MKDNKELMTNSILETAESASAYAEARLEEVRSEYKKRKIKLMKISGMMILTSIILIFATRSWFTMSRSVEGTDASMTASDLPFEIRTQGDNIGPKSHVITKENNEVIDTITDLFAKNTYYSGTNAFNSGTIINNEGYYTDGSNAKIQWHLTGNVDEKGLGPDSSGILTFYVVPKQNGPLTAKFSLNLEGYTAVQAKNEDGTYAVTSLTRVDGSSSQQLKDAVNYLNGHILIFQNVTGAGTANDPYYYKDFISDKSEFEISFPRGGNYETEVKKGVPIEVNLYWKWSNTFGQMAFSAAENSNRRPVFADTTTRDALQQYLVDNRTDIFVQSQGAGAVDLELALVDYQRDSNNQLVPVFKADCISSSTLFEALSLGYNTADQEIGTNLQYTLIVLSAGQ